MPVGQRAPAHGSQQSGQRRHLNVGTTPAAAGDRTQALAKRTHPPVLLEITGARTLRDQAAQEQRWDQGLSALSSRELEIAELVSDGHTNRQIAGKLSLSEKTIETYLSRVFTKLGVSSRAAVASAIVRAGRVPSSARG
jgi:DNA-binding NarL/FixJ family response regulator